MDGIDTQERLEEIPLDRIDFDPDQPRKRFDPQELAELAADLAANGQLQPVRVRPAAGGRYLLVIGERRCRAMATTPRATITAIVRAYTDREALEVQISENGQRADVHPLEEADAFRKLHDKHKVPVEEIAARVGTSVAFIQRRISLANLCDEGREAYFAEQITDGVAQLVARMPVVEHQQAAVKEFTTKHDYASADQRWTVPGARRWIQQHFLLRLANAPFDITDAALVPAAGACASCPKNSGTQPALFAEVTGEDDSCTDASCWKSKVDADWQQKAAEVAKGREVLSAEQSAKVVNHHGAQGGFVRLDDRPHDVGSGRKTWGEILKKAAPAVVLGRDPSGEAVELIAPAEVKRAMKAVGVERTKRPAYGHEQKLVAGMPEYKFRQAVNERVDETITAAAVAAVKKGPTVAMWRAAAASALESFESTTVAALMFPPPEKHPTARLERYVEKATAEQCTALVLTLLLAHDEHADLLKVDVKGVEKALKAELEAELKKKAGAEAAKKGKPSQSAKPAPKKPSAPAKASKPASPSQSPKATPAAPPAKPAEVSWWIEEARWQGLSRDAQATLSFQANTFIPNLRSGASAYRTLGPMPPAVATQLAVAAAELGVPLHASKPDEPTPEPPKKASTKKDAPAPAKGAHAAKPHATTDQRRMMLSPNGACLVVEDERGVRITPRPSKLDDAAWRDDVAALVAGAAGLVVARLYSKKGDCLWDSRDDAPAPVQRFWQLATSGGARR